MMIRRQILRFGGFSGPFIGDPIIEKDGIDRHSKNLGHSERERQARIIFVCFNGIDRLAGYAEPDGQIGLADPGFGPQRAQAIFHDQPGPAGQKPTRRAKTLTI
jgi:hypothetical protein